MSFINKFFFCKTMEQNIFIWKEKKHCCAQYSLEVMMMKLFNIEKNTPGINESFPLNFPLLADAQQNEKNCENLNKIPRNPNTFLIRVSLEQKGQHTMILFGFHLRKEITSLNGINMPYSMLVQQHSSKQPALFSYGQVYEKMLKILWTCVMNVRASKSQARNLLGKYLYNHHCVIGHLGKNLISIYVENGVSILYTKQPNLCKTKKSYSSQYVVNAVTSVTLHL